MEAWCWRRVFGRFWDASSLLQAKKSFSVTCAKGIGQSYSETKGIADLTIGNFERFGKEN